MRSSKTIATLAYFLLMSYFISEAQETFTSTSQKIEFTYPSGWSVELDSLVGDESEIYYYTVILFSPEYSNDSEEKMKSSEYVTISVDMRDLTENGKRMNAERKNMVATVAEMRRILELPEFEVLEIKKELLGKKAYMLTHPVHYGEEHQMFTIYKEKKYVVSLRGSKELNEKYLSIFESIGASLKTL